MVGILWVYCMIKYLHRLNKCILITQTPFINPNDFLGNQTVGIKAEDYS